MPTPSNLSKIQNAQVRTGAEMYDFVYEVLEGIFDESGSSDQAVANVHYELARNVKELSSPKDIAPYFADLRYLASSNGAPQTASAVVSSAKWFWCNVEDPAACQAASRSTGLVSTGGGTPSYARQTLLTKKQKQMVLYVGVPVLLTGIGLYFILRD